MKNTILKSFVWWLTFFFTIFLCFVWYAVWQDLLEVQITDTLTKDRWNEMVTKLNSIWTKVDTLSNIPSWAVMAFNLNSCPTWWIPANGTNGTPDLRWEFIRWLNYDNGINKNSNASVDTWRTLWSWQESSWLAIFWSSMILVNLVNSDWTYWNSSSYAASASQWPYAWVYHRFRPRNVALLYCEKE